VPAPRRRAPDQGRGSRNVLNTIRPYWDGTTWVFDDPQRGLVREPFVAGTPEIIDRALERAGAPPRRPFSAVFSDREFPGWQIMLERGREDSGGAWYRWNGMEGWLCPALLRYFDAAPERIYCQIIGART
jgi:hypothetical protein